MDFVSLGNTEISDGKYFYTQMLHEWAVMLVGGSTFSVPSVGADRERCSSVEEKVVFFGGTRITARTKPKP